VDIIKDYFLETNPNPERKGCPDEATLQGLAEDRLPVSHPAVSILRPVRSVLPSIEAIGLRGRMHRRDEEGSCSGSGCPPGRVCRRRYFLEC